ncbi:MAG: carbohydrate-binding domain-containing protein [Erysipelotrichaceae bacterium]|nr:carbohydrate-binding domain-containing protein [Erysipelotrichaceae bacterium]
MKNIRKTIIVMTAMMLLAGCSRKPPVEDPVPEIPQERTDIEQNSDGFSSDEAITADDIEIKISKRDGDASYDEKEASLITFTASGIKTSGEGFEVIANTVKIKSAGTYIFSGEGQGEIIIEMTSDDKAQLVFNNLTLTNPDGPAILIGQADKVFITLPENTSSTLSDGKSYSLTYDESTVDGAIFAKDDLTINGAGVLTVNGNFAHGIVCKDELTIISATVKVTASSTGINGKDGLILKDADITVKAGNDGLKSSNSEDEGKGFIYIESSGISVNSSDKGIIAETLLLVESGNITVTASDDALHSNNSIIINGGDITLSSGDDGIHADNSLTINAGSIDVTKSYEGLESEVITVNGGDISIKASDDGINAGGQNSNDNGGGFNFGRGGGMMASDANARLTINGGTIYVNASGDGLDSNGYLIINGGKILVDGPTSNGDGAIDYSIQSSVNGGTIVATGSSGMIEKLTGKTQGVITMNVSGSGTVRLKDSDGREIVSFSPEKRYANIVISSPEIQAGGKYTLTYGSSSVSIEMSSLEYTNVQGGGFSGQGQQPGGNQPGGNRPGGNQGPGRR